MKPKDTILVLIVLLFAFLLSLSYLPIGGADEFYDYTLPEVMEGETWDLSADVGGAGGYYGECIQVTLYNSASDTKMVKVPVGTELVPANAYVQTMYTAGGEVLRADPGTSTHRINAFCGEMHDGAPGTGDTFSFGGYANSDLMNILEAINDQEAYNSDGQHAVWHETDDRDISEDEGAQAVVHGAGPGGTQAATTAVAASVLVLIWMLLNNFADSSTFSTGGGGGSTKGGGSPGSHLIDPDTGEPLVVQDGNYEGGGVGQVWYDGQWVDENTAATWIAERQDELTARQQEQDNFWSDVERDRDQRISDRADQLQRDGYVYDTEQDAWVPGQNHPDAIENRRQQEAQRLNDFIERNVDDLTRADFLQDLVDRVRLNGGDMDRLRDAIKDSTIGADQQLSMGDSEAALAEADAWRESEEYAADVRDWSQRANRLIGRFVPGTGPVINAIQNAAYGTVQGYEKGGWRGALTSAAAQAADELMEKYTHLPGIGSAFRDAYGTGYEKDKNGNWISPLDRMTSDLWHNIADQYDPSVYIDRLQHAESIGDYFDVGMDALEAGEDVRDAGDRIRDAYEGGIRIGDRGENLPIIDGTKDGEFSRGSDDDFGLGDRNRDIDIVDSPMTDKTQRMADRIATDENGKPYADLDDVLDIQRSTQDTRSLKGDGVDPQVREAFNNTLRERVYESHDAALIDHVRKNVPDMGDREIKVHDFRTPGADAGSINTDRDYRVLYKDDNGNWLEVDRRQWEGVSNEKFAELTGYEPDKARDMLPTESQREGWDNLSDAERKARWAEMHSQAATDKFHPEASPDYSDQGIDKMTGGRFEKDRAHILDVEEGIGTPDKPSKLDDPRALADMYQEKADVYLRQGNRAEAIAQIKKGVHTLDEVRSGYEKQGLDVGELPSNVSEGMKIINKAKVDHRANPAEVESKLRDAGFDGIEDFNKKLGGQIESMKFAGKHDASVTSEPSVTPEKSGASRSYISTRIRWQKFKEGEDKQ